MRYDDSDWATLDESFLYREEWNDFYNESAASVMNDEGAASVVSTDDHAANIDFSTTLHNVHSAASDSAASEISRLTSPSMTMSHAAPVLLPVAPIAEDTSAASEISRLTSPSVALSHAAPVLPPVAPIAENHECLWEGAAAPVATDGVCHATSKHEKRLRPRELTYALRNWMERCPSKPYATLEEKKLVAEAFNISVKKVTNFCNNFRKRFVKIGDTLTSYRGLAFATQGLVSATQGLVSAYD